MRCPRCEADTPNEAKFCIECGTPLRPRCPQCGADTLPQAKFCGECGTPLTARSPAPPAAPPPSPLRYTPGYLAEKILTSKATLEGERKQVTVLFADVKGSMELLADRDPEEARAMLDPVLERMMAAVHRYEETVNQVMGDGIMALFGAPIAHEDHAVRACYAALRMQESVKHYAVEVQRTKGVPLHIRVGLNAGKIVVRSIGSDLHMDYTAVGQTTQLAARMEQMAMPGSILITAKVLRLAEGHIQVNALGPVPIKGLHAPVEIFGDRTEEAWVHTRRSIQAPSGAEVAQSSKSRTRGHGIAPSRRSRGRMCSSAMRGRRRSNWGAGPARSGPTPAIGGTRSLRSASDWLALCTRSAGVRDGRALCSI